MSNISLPDFENPPLTEVACGIALKPLDPLTAAHLGVLWGKYQPEHPKVEEHSPIPLAIELLSPATITGPQFEIMNMPPLPREMFISADDLFVIQVQRDRFGFNWRKLKDEDTYPRYPQVIAKFEEKLGVFKEFLETLELVMEPIQYELTYTNHIPLGEMWNDPGDIGNIFPFVSGSIDGKVIRRPEHVNFRMSFLLPPKAGRLHVSLRSNAIRRRDNKPMIVFELTARGAGNGDSEDARREWFDLARSWIVNGFTDLTSADAHKKLWRRVA